MAAAGVCGSMLFIVQPVVLAVISQVGWVIF
jgi:hypothetical protein